MVEKRDRGFDLTLQLIKREEGDLKWIAAVLVMQM